MRFQASFINENQSISAKLNMQIQTETTARTTQRLNESLNPRTTQEKKTGG
jgi:hypothetical protein